MSDRAVPPADSHDRARRYVRRMANVRESSQRAAALIAALAERDAVESVWLLEHLVRGALRKDPGCALLYGALVDARRVDEALGSERSLALLGAAQEAQCIGALQWLGAPAGSDALELVRRDLLIDKDLRHLTLGHRRSLARRARGDQLTRLISDPDPVVIENVLRNPTTTEATVLAICARRPTVSAPLEAVQRSPRWNCRYRVRLALVRNPYLAGRCAVTLLACLEVADLVSIRHDETLSGGLRLAAQRLVDLVTSEAAAP